ncbi:MAG: YqeG family HAD IIIA-type phosphatase [Eubacteriales bacterium]|nr:YqeG family HAD IIIA-type phosphatase [Eubacteriales bacterium]
MFKRFYPYAYVDSVFAIDYQKLYHMGYRGLIFDIDNTLVHHGDDSTPEIDDLFFRIQNMGFQTLLLSNNTEERIQSFLKNIDSLYIDDARKPETAGYYKAIEMLGLEKEKIMFVGDQVFTDILGANQCGLASILVKFIRIDENAPIGKRRHVENIILKFYRRNKKYRDRLGDITV